MTLMSDQEVLDLLADARRGHSARPIYPRVIRLVERLMRADHLIHTMMKEAFPNEPEKSKQD